MSDFDRVPFPLLPWTDYWDPRPESEAEGDPIPGSCNLPLDELRERVAELPPKGSVVRIVATGDLAERAMSALQEVGRAGVVAKAPPIAQTEARRLWERCGRGPSRASLGPPPKGRKAARLWRPHEFLDAVLREIGSPLTPSRTPPSDALRESKGGAVRSSRFALDLACGAGREALLMASWGWRVVALDVLPDALAIGRALERRYADPQAPRVDWRLADLERDDAFSEAYRMEGSQADLERESAHEGAKFGLVTCFRYLHRPLLANVADLLESGGNFVFETFTSVHREHFGKPARERFVLAPGELPGLVPNLQILHFEEGWHEGSHTARLWARKP